MCLINFGLLGNRFAGEGENMFGRMLMRLRDERKNKISFHLWVPAT